MGVGGGVSSLFRWFTQLKIEISFFYENSNYNYSNLRPKHEEAISPKCLKLMASFVFLHTSLLFKISKDKFDIPYFLPSCERKVGDRKYVAKFYYFMICHHIIYNFYCTNKASNYQFP